MTGLTYEKSQGKFINKTLLYMSLGLIITFVTAILMISTGIAIEMYYALQGGIFIIAVIELGLVVYISRRINKITASKAMGLFLLYSFVNGITFSVILLGFDLTLVLSAFMLAAAMFFCASMVGMTYPKDLSAVGRIAIMAVLGLIIASVFNWFVRSSGLYTIISYAGVAIFCILTAYDMQKIKNIHRSAYSLDAETSNKYAIIAALNLYLDFINIFVYILRIFGASDD